MPFCAAARTATVVVLSRRSAPERVRPAAPTTPAAERGSACCSAGAGGLPRLLLLLRPYRHIGACGKPDHDVRKTGRVVVARKQTPSSRQLGRFAWLLAAIAIFWLVVAVTGSAQHHSTWYSYAFAIGFGLGSLYMTSVWSHKRGQGPVCQADVRHLP